jgi:myo-inositol-1(or 4)-monophosphatase
VHEPLQTALRGALAGARVLRERARDAGAVTTKSSAVDLVSEADVASGVAVVEAIVVDDPQARFVVEESEVYGLADVTPGALRDDEVWVVDPLDGTTSFVHGFPFYSVSVALLREGTPEVGVVHSVPADETFAAARGLGATLDGTPLACSKEPALDRALLMTGFPYDRGETLTRQLEVFGRFMKVIHGVRRDGSAALDLCHVAAGRADGFWEFGLSAWDTAAGALVAEEAGALVTDFDGAPWTPDTRDVAAANPELHARILEVVRND